MSAEQAASARLEFTLAGKACSLSREELVSALSGELPADIREYWVEINGKEWPVKQVISVATSLENTEFGSTHAQSLLKKLGFEVKSVVKSSRAKMAAQGERSVDDPSVRNRGTQKLSTDVATLVKELHDESRRVSVDEFLTSSDTSIDLPGIYAWWVDSGGAAELSRGFDPGEKLEPGLVYAGLAGATRTNGKRSQNTLRKRIVKMHLGKRHTFSTLRWSVGSILAEVHEAGFIDEESLTEWMRKHLQVVAVPFTDVDTLGQIETDILAELDPPLNLAKVSRKTPRRIRLRALKKKYYGTTKSD